MRFRAILSKVEVLQDVVGALEGLGSKVLILLESDSVRLILGADFTSGEQSYAELPQAQLFDDYRLESKHNNRIFFLASLSNLSKALMACHNAERALLKLTKKNGGRAHLTFEIRVSSSVEVTQDVPIAIQAPNTIVEYAEPELPPPAVKFKMPKIDDLIGIIDKMKKVSDQLTITANSQGNVCFEVVNNEVAIRTYYKNLQVSSERQGLQPSGEQVVTASATMSIKKFSNVVRCKSVKILYALGCIVEDMAFVLYLRLSGEVGTLTYYIPLIAPEEN
jgi:HUS1 checkpoint protein